MQPDVVCTGANNGSKVLQAPSCRHRTILPGLAPTPAVAPRNFSALADGRGWRALITQIASKNPAKALRNFARILAREGVGSWLVILVAAGALASLHQVDAFQVTDTRFFDEVSTRAAGSRPVVAIVERDAAFERQGDQRFAGLEAAVVRLGVARLGYLGGRETNSASRDGIADKLTIVEGLTPKKLPASDAWSLTDGGSRGTVTAARVLASAQYGIYRQQWSAIAGEGQDIETFETALAGQGSPNRERFYVRMPGEQSIPVISASQILSQQFAAGDLAGAAVIVAHPRQLSGTMTTPLTPDQRTTSEAEFRAFAVQNLRSASAVLPAQIWEAWLLTVAFAIVVGIAYHRSDPKRLAVLLPLAANILALVLSYAALELADRLLPLTAMLLAPWLVTFLRVLGRERYQDRRLEESASRAVQHAFGRSALREGARLPDFLNNAARLAAVERSLLIERRGDGTLGMLNATAATFDDIALEPSALGLILDRLRDRHAVIPATEIVPSWEGNARITWLGGTGRDLYWLYTLPKTGDPRKSAHLVRAISASFRELFRWRAHLNARKSQDQRFVPIDDKVASAISLVAQSSEQIRHGFDTVGTAVMIFHMVGSPLHANAPMQEIYRQAGLTVSETSLREALQALTDLDDLRIDAMLQDMLLNGGEMRVPMQRFGAEERIFRIAAPTRIARSRERVLVMEAIDVSELHRAADLRQAVALFMDLQLRNDFEAIMLGSELAMDPRVTADKVRPIVARITETTRRAIDRLDQVAGLVREDIWDLEDASYPVDARSIVLEAAERSSEFAEDFSVQIETDVPDASGFTIAEPAALGAMLRAILRVLIADTPQGDSVQLKLEELDGRTHIRISGGFGIALERLLQLLSENESDAVGDYRTISEGMARAVQWDASVSYWGREADGFGFNINLRRIG